MSRIDSLIINNTEYRLNVNRINNLQTTINNLQTIINSLTNRIYSLEEGNSIGSIQLTLYEKNNNNYDINVQTTNVSNRNNIKYYTMFGNRNNHTEQNITSYVNYISGNNNNFRVRVSTNYLSSADFGNFGWYNDPSLVNRWNIRAEVTDDFSNDISYKLFIDDTQQIEYYTITFDGFDSSNASSMTVSEGTEITLPTSASKNDTDQFSFTFTGWLNNSTNETYDPGDQVTIYDDTTFTAQFESYAKAESILEVYYNENQGDILQLNNYQDTGGPTISNGYQCVEVEGTWLYFKAEPKIGYNFSHWLYDGQQYTYTTNNHCFIEKSLGTHTLQAVFVTYNSNIGQVNYYMIPDSGEIDVYDDNGSESYSGGDIGTYSIGTGLVFRATSYGQNEFYGFVIDGQFSGITVDPELTVFKDHNVVAYYRDGSLQNPIYNDTQGSVSVNGAIYSEGGSGDDLYYPIGATLNLAAIPKTGYRFDHWEIDRVNVGSSNPYTFTVTTSLHELRAVFVSF